MKTISDNRYNVVIGCDQNYYDKWATTLLSSIARHNPWLELHCHIVNPTHDNKLENVSITSEQKEFKNDDAKISYLQSVRFIIAEEKFSNKENVFTLDADTICTRPISNEEIKYIFKKQHILKYYRKDRWLAGLVVFNQNGFRQAFYKELTSIPFDDWEWGRDQTVLNTFAKDFNFKSAGCEPGGCGFMAIGANKANAAFLTLKGRQKNKQIYLNHYAKYVC